MPSRRVRQWNPPEAGFKAFDPARLIGQTTGRHYSSIPESGPLGMLKLPGISRTLAMISQAAGLASTAMVSLSFLIFDQTALVLYTAVTAPLLLVISAFDAGMNQDFLLNGKRKFWIYGKIALVIFSTSLLIFLSVDMPQSEHVGAAAFYGAALVFFSGCVAITWRKQLYRLEAAARLAVGVITFAATLLALSVRADPVVIILLAQAVGMTALGFFVLSIAAGGDTRGNIAPSDRRPRAHFQGILSAFTRGFILNLISNGIFLGAQASGASVEQLVDVRLVTLIAVAVTAATPVAPQHFIALPVKQRNRITNALLGLGVFFSIASLAVNSLYGIDYKGTILAVAVGLSVGALVTRLHLKTNIGSFSLVRTIQTICAGLCAVTSTYVLLDVLGGAISILFGTLSMAFMFDAWKYVLALILRRRKRCASNEV